MVMPAFIRPALALIVTAAVVFIVVAVFRNGSNRSSPVQSAFQQLPQNVDIALKQARFVDMKDGQVDWVLLADKVEYDKSGEIAYLTGGIKMDFVKSETRGAIKVTADRAEYLSNTKNIKLRGNVHLVTDDGVIFDTDQIDYTAAISQFKTSEKVVFQQERLKLNAIGMEMDVKDHQARFFKMVDATVIGLSIIDKSKNSVKEKR